MKSSRHWNRIALAALLGLFASASHAHTGHASAGFYEGLVHPLGLDHLLAMVAVGFWSVCALPAHRAWLGPVTFMASLVLSASLGALGFSIAHLEVLISLSVVLFGAMLVLARFALAPKVGLVLIALAASLHGLAHGAESPPTGFATYATGFLLSTALLHLAGVVACQGIKRYVPNKTQLAATAFGLMLGGAGLVLFTQV